MSQAIFDSGKKIKTSFTVGLSLGLAKCKGRLFIYGFIHKKQNVHSGDVCIRQIDCVRDLVMDWKMYSP